MSSTFVIEGKGFDYIFEIDYQTKFLTLSFVDFFDSVKHYKLSDQEITNVENYEAETMIKNTKKGWDQLEKYLLKLIK